ncbi:MAG: phospholipid carrier-dependent glycosyltransferase [Steroidobacteraceae bacterium]
MSREFFAQRLRRHGWWLALLVLWCATMAWRPLLDPDEARYARIPQEMIESGDWVTPHLNGLKYFEKPPLQYWATAALYKVFGVHEWTARLWGCALGFACLPLLYGFARRIGWPRERAQVAVALLAINPLYLVVGQITLLDQGFTFFCVATLFALVLGQGAPPGSRAERHWMLAGWLTLALAVLSKGLVAPLLLALTLSGYCLMQRDLSVLKRLHALPGLALLLIVTLPWFIAVQRANPDFAWFFFVHEHYARFTTNVHHRTGAWWYFLAITSFALLPWLPRLPGALRRALRAPAPAQGLHVERLLWIWCVTVLVFFSISHSKLPPYVLPIMPPLALLLAGDLEQVQTSWRRVGAVTLAVVLALAAGLAFYGWHSQGELDAPLRTALALAALIAGLGLVWIARAPQTTAAALHWLAIGGVAMVCYQALLIAYNGLPQSPGSKPFAVAVGDFVDARTQVFTVGQYRHGVNYYLDRNQRVFEYDGELAFGLAQRGLSRARCSLAAFRDAWRRADDAIAIVDREWLPLVRMSGVHGTIVAADARSVALRRDTTRVD